MAEAKEKETYQQLRAAALQQETYISLPFHQQMARWEKLRTFPIAKQSKPRQRCGYAQRIGSVGDLSLSRLRIYDEVEGDNTVTLPGLFFLEEGAFQLFRENEANETKV